jgi:sugar (pentulose or hexulose) kinase
MKALMAGTALIATTAIAIAQDRDLFTGTWTLNVAKSTMVSPATASKSETVTYRHVNGEEITARTWPIRPSTPSIWRPARS